MGSSLAFTDGVFHEAEKIYTSRRDKEIDNYYVAVGGLGGGLVNQGITFITMKDPGKRGVFAPFKKEPSQQEYMAFMREQLSKIPGIQRVAILDLSLTGFSAQRGYPIEFVLQGPDWTKLANLSLDMRKRLSESEHARNRD